MKDMKKKINQYLLTICAIFVAVVGMVFWHLQFYESAIFILLSWTALLSLYFAGEETKSVEREHTIQYLRKRNEELQETVNSNKGSMSFMTNYISELEKLIIDDDVEKIKKKGKRKTGKGREEARSNQLLSSHQNFKNCA